MLVPITIRAANMIMTQSKYSHDMAVDLMTGTTTYLFEHPDIPEPVRNMAIELMSKTVLWGDDIGNMMVRLYVFLIHLVH